MKVCLINNLYKPYSRGGADKVAENISLGLENNGHEVFVISTKPVFKKQKNNETTKQKIFHINSLFYHLNKIPMPVRLFWHLSDLISLRKYFQIKKILKKEKPDLVITHNLKGIGFFTPRAIRKLKIKHTHYLHDIQLIHPSGLMIYGEEKKIESIPARVYAWLCKKLFGSPGIIISPSKWLLDLHERKKFFTESEKQILLNPIIKSQKPARPAGGSIVNCQLSEAKFVYVGEVEEQKGILLLVNTFLKLPREFELTIIGQGTKLGLIKKLAQERDDIKILGWQKNEEVRKIMAESDALIMPSLCYENSPTVIYEAISEGLPVLASNLGGVKELIEKFGGMTFEPADEKNLRDQIINLTRNLKEIKKTAHKGRGETEEIELKNYISKLLELITNLP